jgi:hypothetical protein
MTPIELTEMVSGASERSLWHYYLDNADDRGSEPLLGTLMCFHLPYPSTTW